MRSSMRLRTRPLAVALALAVLVAMLPVAPASGAGMTYHVDAGSGDDGDAGGPTDPFRSIGHALAVSGSGDEIVVHAGLHDSSVETLPLMMKPGVDLHAAGGEEVVVDGGGTRQLMKVGNATTGTVIEGFVFRNGASDFGGAMEVFGSSTPEHWPLIARNVFESNETTGGSGGAIRIASATTTSTPRLVGNEFVGNTSASFAGAVDVYLKAHVLFEDNVFAGNVADGDGGAVHVYAGAVASFLGDEFHGNTASGDGGGVAASGAELLLKDCRLDSNTATPGSGGGVWLGGGRSRIDRTRILSNYARNDGGAIHLSTGELTLASSVLSNNDCGDDWGGLSGAGGTTMTVVQCSFASNFGVDEWGNGTAGASEVYGSILWELSGCWSGPPLVQCIVSDPAVPGVSLAFDDPLFRDVVLGDLMPLVGSPAIDSVTPTCPLTTLYDLDGRSRPLDGDNDGTAWDDMGAFERPVPDPLRLAGGSRYDTAVEVVRERFGETSNAVLASGASFPDALSAAGLCGALDGPLLLTRPNSVPASVLTLLADLGVTDVWIVGGATAVSNDVVVQLEGAGLNVERIAGADRYDTAAAVARRIREMQGPRWSGLGFLARGDSFPDALALAPLATFSGEPVLLTRPTSLPATVAGTISDLGFSRMAAAGGTAAISDGVLTQVGLLGPTTQRIPGANRYATAAAVAEFGATNGYADWALTGVASGADFPDALSGGVALGANGGLMLLTSPVALSTPTVQKLTARREYVLMCDVYGGTSAIGESVRVAVKSALGW